MSYLKLFWSFFQIGLFSFGGGYAALPLIQDQVVSGHHWLTMKEFADVITISQMTPGPIAINSASFVVTMGGRSNRIQYETLVAMGSMTGDGSDDTLFPDS